MLWLGFDEWMNISLKHFKRFFLAHKSLYVLLCVLCYFKSQCFIEGFSLDSGCQYNLHGGRRWRWHFIWPRRHMRDTRGSKGTAGGKGLSTPNWSDLKIFHNLHNIWCFSTTSRSLNLFLDQQYVPIHLSYWTIYPFIYPWIVLIHFCIHLSIHQSIHSFYPSIYSIHSNIQPFNVLLSVCYLSVISFWFVCSTVYAHAGSRCGIRLKWTSIIHSEKATVVKSSRVAQRKPTVVLINSHDATWEKPLKTSLWRSGI